MERLEDGPLRPHAHPERHRHLHVLPQGGPAGFQALCVTHQHRSGAARPCPSPRRRPTPANSPKNSARSSPRACPADTSALDNGVLDEGGIPGAGRHRPSREPGDVRIRIRRASTRGCFSITSRAPTSASTCSGACSTTSHPAYDARLAGRFGGAIEDIYREGDTVSRPAMRRGSTRRRSSWSCPTTGSILSAGSFNLNTWLLENGYHRLQNPFKQDGGRLLRKHGLVEDQGLRRRAQRALHQPAGPGGRGNRRPGRRDGYPGP